MANEIAEEGMIRRYLLGQLAEDERQQLEERIMTDTELYNRVLLAEDEMVEEYVQGGLSVSEREGFEAVFLSTVEGRRQVSFEKALSSYVSSNTASEGQATRQSVGDETAGITGESAPAGKVIRAVWWSRPTVAPYFRMTAAAVIVLGVGLGIWRVFFYQSEVAKGMAALARAYGTERPLEARISGLNYAPYPDTRGIEQTRVDDTSLDRAERILLDEVAERPSPEAHHALGRFYLAEQQFDKAIVQFEKALKGDPNNAELHSDYGAALLELGKDSRLKSEPGKSMEAFAKGLEHSEKALELDGSRLDALFNRALLYQYMGLPQAEDDWKEYLQKDPDSEWSNEARRRLSDFEEKKKTRSRSKADLLQEFVKAHQSKSDDKAYELISKNTEAVTGQLVWWQLLGAHLDLSLKRESDGANQYLEALSYAGELQEQRVGDRFISDLVRFYRSCSSERKVSLAQAHALINRAHALLARSEVDRAVDLYEKAKVMFMKAGDQLESRFAGCWKGYCHYRKSEFRESLSELSQVAQYSRAKSYRWLHAQALTLIANIQLESSQFSKSIACYNESLEISKEIDDAYNIQRNLSSLAHVYGNLGDPQEPLTYMQRCLESAGSCWPGVRQMYRNYYTAAGILNSFNYHIAAAGYEKAALQLALEEADPIFEHQSYVHLGAIYAKLEDYAEALKYGELSYQAAGRMDERTRLRPIADSSLQLGHIYRRAGSYDEALRSYDESVKLYEGMNLFAFLYESRKGRLLCYIGQRNDTLAREELQTVLTLFEEHRSKIVEEKNRNSFFDLEQYVYDIAIDFEHSRNRDYQKAFEYSEISRARSLLDLMTTGTEGVGKENANVTISSVARPLGLTSIRERMPKQAQVLQYAVLEDKLLIWVISRTKFDVAEQKITSNSLTTKALNYLQSVSNLSESNSEESRRDAIELYELLIKPVELLLEKDKQICIVPDKVLHRLPFNVLVSADSGKYVIDDYLLSFAPSSTIFLLCCQTARERSVGGIERVLTVGDPRFNTEAFPGLPALRSSGKEAEEIAGCYKSSRCLVGADATKERIRSEMEKADIIHFASHYVIDEYNPMYSKLLLTQGTNGLSKNELSDSVLQAYEICSKELRITRLVALSACQTGVERYYRGEGMIGMSRTFLAAGVPLVAASLWPVASDPTADLMISFHKYRKHEGLSTAQALRQAQLDMINDPRHLYERPCYWAPFIIIGGYASF